MINRNFKYDTEQTLPNSTDVQDEHVERKLY